MNVYPCGRLYRFRVRDTWCSSRRCNWHAHWKSRLEPYHLPVTELPRLFLFKVYNTVCGITYTKFQEWRSPLRSSKSLQKEPQRIWKAEGFTDNHSRRFFEPHANGCNDTQALRTRSNYSHIHKYRKILFNKTNRSTNFPNLFCQENLHVSGSSSAHHQECSTVHSALVYVIKTAWHVTVQNVQWKTPDDGQRNCPKHVDFRGKINVGN